MIPEEVKADLAAVTIIVSFIFSAASLWIAVSTRKQSRENRFDDLRDLTHLTRVQLGAMSRRLSLEADLLYARLQPLLQRHADQLSADKMGSIAALPIMAAAKSAIAKQLTNTQQEHFAILASPFSVENEKALRHMKSSLDAMLLTMNEENFGATLRDCAEALELLREADRPKPTAVAVLAKDVQPSWAD